MTGPALIIDEGRRIALDVDRWRSEPDATEAALLSWLPAPLLDVGCGPGRLTAAVAATGRVALGIDSSLEAVDEAARRGAPALHRSVFAALPGEGRWSSAVLLDGNIGIGGDPVRLLARLRELLRPGGVVLAEVEASGGCETHMVRVDVHGRRGQRFPWATVGADAWPKLVHAARLAAGGIVDVAGRRFATAVRQ